MRDGALETLERGTRMAGRDEGGGGIREEALGPLGAREHTDGERGTQRKGEEERPDRGKKWINFLERSRSRSSHTGDVAS